MADGVGALLVVIVLANDAKGDSIDLAAMLEWDVGEFHECSRGREDEVVLFPKQPGAFNKKCFAGGEEPDRNLVAREFLLRCDAV